MTNPNDTAYPAAGVQNYEESNQVGGLTKLEMFSAMAMQGDAASLQSDSLWEDNMLHRRAQEWVKMSKALIEALNKEGK